MIQVTEPHDTLVKLGMRYWKYVVAFSNEAGPAGCGTLSLESSASLSHVPRSISGEEIHTPKPGLPIIGAPETMD
jgi:hypothetical protein